MVFVGYEPGSKAYHLWDPTTCTIKISDTIRFEEDVLPSRPKPEVITKPSPIFPDPQPPTANVTDIFGDQWHEDPPFPWSGSLPGTPSPPSSPHLQPSSTHIQPPTSQPPPSPTPSNNSNKVSDELQQQAKEPVAGPSQPHRSTRIRKPVEKFSSDTSKPKLWSFQQKGENEVDAMDRVSGR